MPYTCCENNTSKATVLRKSSGISLDNNFFFLIYDNLFQRCNLSIVFTSTMSCPSWELPEYNRSITVYSALPANSLSLSQHLITIPVIDHPLLVSSSLILPSYTTFTKPSSFILIICPDHFEYRASALQQPHHPHLLVPVPKFSYSFSLLSSSCCTSLPSCSLHMHL